MTTELRWLVYTAILAGSLWIPFIVGVTLLIGTIVDELIRRRSRVHR